MQVAKIDAVKQEMASDSRKSVATGTEPPAGLVYLAGFTTPQEEAELVASIEELEFHQVVMHDTAARRTTAHFGWDYGYESHDIHPAAPIPDFLLGLRRRAADLVELAAEDLAEVLITRYPAGATIGWHRDAPMFGPRVVGVSLLSPCVMRFRRRSGDRFLRYDQPLDARSAYVLGGAARSVWQHSIPPVPSLRYSITFRTLRTAGRIDTR